MSDPAIEVLHVGSASRDLTEDDPRGWRLGGGVTYGALATARLGLRTAAVIGVDEAAAGAAELELLRLAGVELHIVRLAEAPVFRNLEAPGGRTQECVAPGLPVPVTELPAGWSAAVATWSLVPVAGEVGEGWASAVPDGALVALGWQGLLRDLAAGRVVRRRRPRASRLLRRANLVGVSRHDLVPGTGAADLRSLLRSDSDLLLTDGERGGQLLRPGIDGPDRSWQYDAIPPDVEVDPTGAGDVFLAALTAWLVRPSIVGGARSDPGSALAFAAAAASLVIERPGLLGVPDLPAVAARARRGRPDGLERRDAGDPFA